MSILYVTLKDIPQYYHILPKGTIVLPDGTRFSKFILEGHPEFFKRVEKAEIIDLALNKFATYGLGIGAVCVKKEDARKAMEDYHRLMSEISENKNNKE